MESGGCSFCTDTDISSQGCYCTKRACGVDVNEDCQGLIFGDFDNCVSSITGVQELEYQAKFPRGIF